MAPRRLFPRFSFFNRIGLPDSFVHFLGKAWVKATFISIGAFFVAIALTGFSILLIHDTPPDPSTVDAGDIIPVLFSWAFFFFLESTHETIVPVISQYWAEKPILVATFIVFAPVIVAVIGYYVLKVITIFDKYLLANLLGAKMYLPRHSDRERSKNWEECCGEIEEMGTHFLFVMGASGAETFGHSQAPLYETIMKQDGDVKVMLLSPNSTDLNKRARSVAEDEAHPEREVATYHAEIWQSIQCLKLRHDSGKRVSLCLYDRLPGWKNIFCDRFLWLQHYKDDVHVEDTPAYVFYANKKRTSLYHSFLTEYHRQWDRATKIDLAKTEEEIGKDVFPTSFSDQDT